MDNRPSAFCRGQLISACLLLEVQKGHPCCVHLQVHSNAAGSIPAGGARETRVSSHIKSCANARCGTTRRNSKSVNTSRQQNKCSPKRRRQKRSKLGWSQNHEPQIAFASEIRGRKTNQDQRSPEMRGFRRGSSKFYPLLRLLPWRTTASRF